VTLLTAAKAAARARTLLEPGEQTLPPRFVHDGPPGRAIVREAGETTGTEPGVE
jgi:hypothetical protein